MSNQKEVRETTIQKRDDYIHIETKGCIVNIYPCLFKMDGTKCTAIEVIPDRTDPKYMIEEGMTGITRVIEDIR